MHMLSKIFNTLEKIASTNERILQAYDTMEKAAVTASGPLRALLKARKAYIARAENTGLTRQQALDKFYKHYGLQVGEGGHISAIEGVKLNNRVLARQEAALSAMEKNKQMSRSLFPANNLFNNNWWKYGLAGAGGFALGRTTASDPQPMPVMMPPQPMPVMMPPQPMPAMAYNGMQY